MVFGVEGSALRMERLSLRDCTVERPDLIEGLVFGAEGMFSGFGFRVSGFGFQVEGFRFMV